MKSHSDDIRAAVYQAAVTAYTYEGAQVWARFNAMVVAHGIFIVAIAQLLTDKSHPLIVAAPAIIGLLISVLGLSINFRGFGYQRAFLAEAKNLEYGLSAQFLSRATEPQLLGPIGRFFGCLEMLHSTTIIIFLFVVLYFLVLVYLLLRCLGVVA